MVVAVAWVVARSLVRSEEGARGPAAFLHFVASMVKGT